MKKVFSGIAWVLGVAVISLVLSGLTFAAETKAESKEKPGATVTQETKLTADVVKIDHKKRIAVLAGPDGNTLEIHVKPDIKNLDRVKVGDKLNITYTQTVSIHVRSAKEGTSTQAASASTENKVNEGGMPGRTEVNKLEFIAKVISLDQKKRLVTLKGPEGNEQTYEVDKSVKKLKNVKVGDEVVVNITETTAGIVEAVEQTKK
jgi:hypothetical protein